MSTLKNDAGYCVGMSVAQSLANQDLEDISLDDFVKAIEDVFGKKNLRFSPQEANAIINKYLEEQSVSKYQKNKQEGIDFLNSNAKKDGVVSLQSGLQYEIINKGNGSKPGATSQVTVHYHGTLIDGTVFDSSIERGNPATFGVNQVIAGWTEALQLMETGAKWKLFIPENLAYGANPHPNSPIKPFMTLIFDVELLSVN